MPLRCHCDNCRTDFVAPEKAAGKKIACPVCHLVVRVPGDVAPMPSAAPAQPVAQKQPTLIEALDEAIGTRPMPMGAATPAREEINRPWDPRYGVGRSRSTIRLSRQAAIGVLVAGFLALYLIVLLALPRLGMVLGWVLFGGGVLLVFSGAVWQLYVAMREETACLIWSIVFPFYAMFYLITRWDRTRKAFVTMLIGVAVCGGSLLAVMYANRMIGQRSGVVADKQEKPRPKAAAPRAEPAASVAPAKPATKPAAEPVAKPEPKPAAKKSDEDRDIAPATDLLTPPEPLEPPQ